MHLISSKHVQCEELKYRVTCTYFHS